MATWRQYSIAGEGVSVGCRLQESNGRAGAMAAYFVDVLKLERRGWIGGDRVGGWTERTGHCSLRSSLVALQASQPAYVMRRYPRAFTGTETPVWQLAAHLTHPPLPSDLQRRNPESLPRRLRVGLLSFQHHLSPSVLAQCRIPTPFSCSRTTSSCRSSSSSGPRRSTCAAIRKTATSRARSTSSGKA